MSAADIIQKYTTYFKKRGHKQIPNASLVPENDPTTLFTSSGMQPLVPYLLGEKHPLGTRLVNVQNSFRAQDIDEIGDNRHITFFRMLGNWSLGDYFKSEQLPWIFDFLTSKEEGLGLDPQKLFVTVFEGNKDVPKDTESIEIWKGLFKEKGIDAKEGERIFAYDAKKNWWSRSGTQDSMPPGEPGGPDSEIFYDFGRNLKIHENSPYKEQKCHVNCDCGRYIEIANSVFMQYQKQEDGSFKELSQKNVDFGGGLERFLLAKENQPDVFQTSLFKPIIQSIETIASSVTPKRYDDYKQQMRIIADHLVAAVFIVNSGVVSSNKEQGYVLRRLIRRAFDNINTIRGIEEMMIPTKRITEMIAKQYRQTDPILEENSVKILNTILAETNKYRFTLTQAQRFVKKKYKIGDDFEGVSVISAEDAFFLYTSYGLSPTQIKSLKLEFNDQEFADLMEKHQNLSRSGAAKKFAGGLADHEEKTVMGHTATHLIHQALRDVLGDHVYQSGSNITTERVRFDFNFERKLSPDEIRQVEKIVNTKIKENLPVHYEFMPLPAAKKLGAIGLFDEKYSDNVKIYFIGDGSSQARNNAYSVEFCGGPHVEFTGKLKSFTITKEEGLGNGMRRIYAVVE